MYMNTTIIINPYCHQGLGWKRWLSIRTEVRKKFPGANQVVLDTGMDISGYLNPLLNTGNDHYIISAGGDGSIHKLVNEIQINLQDIRPYITLGAIGLGSSNDFIKPVRQKIGGIPVRIGFLHTVLHDLGTVNYIDERGNQCKKYFIINASLGVTAYGNQKFNSPGKLLGFLKRNAVPMAILYTAFSTLLKYRNFYCAIRVNDEILNAQVTNINILKLPYVSGQFRYDQEIKPDDGKLSVNISHGMNFHEMIKALYQLGNGNLTAGARNFQAFCSELDLTPAHPVIMECDGETFLAREINIHVNPKAIRVSKN